MNSILETADWWVLGLYFAALIGVAVWVVLQKNKNIEDYLVSAAPNYEAVKGLAFGTLEIEQKEENKDSFDTI